MDYFANKIDKLKRDLRGQFEINSIDIPQAKDVDEYNQQLLCLKKLKKLASGLFIVNRDLFNKLKMKRIVCHPKMAGKDEAALNEKSKYDINITYIFHDEQLLSQVN